MSESPRKFRKKPVEVEAVQWRGGNLGDVRVFVGSGDLVAYSSSLTGGLSCLRLWVAKSGMWADRLPPGTWVVREPDGSGVYPCAEADFEATYEPVAPEAAS